MLLKLGNLYSTGFADSGVNSFFFSLVIVPKAVFSLISRKDSPMRLDGATNLLWQTPAFKRYRKIY